MQCKSFRNTNNRKPFVKLNLEFITYTSLVKYITYLKPTLDLYTFCNWKYGSIANGFIDNRRSLYFESAGIAAFYYALYYLFQVENK